MIVEIKTYVHKASEAAEKVANFLEKTLGDCVDCTQDNRVTIVENGITNVYTVSKLNYRSQNSFFVDSVELSLIN